MWEKTKFIIFWGFTDFSIQYSGVLGLKMTKKAITAVKTYKVGRVQDPVLHRVGQVQGELPSSSLLGLLADCRPLLFDL